MTDNSSFVVTMNQGDGTFGNTTMVNYGGACSINHSRFADFNGDGK
jgi:hypothetical protein